MIFSMKLTWHSNISEVSKYEKDLESEVTICLSCSPIQAGIQLNKQLDWDTKMAPPLT